MDTGAYVTDEELRLILNLIDSLNSSEFSNIDSTLAFDVTPVDVNGESMGEISRVDGTYRWYPNGRE